MHHHLLIRYRLHHPLRLLHNIQDTTLNLTFHHRRMQTIRKQFKLASIPSSMVPLQQVSHQTPTADIHHNRLTTDLPKNEEAIHGKETETDTEVESTSETGTGTEIEETFDAGIREEEAPDTTIMCRCRDGGAEIAMAVRCGGRAVEAVVEVAGITGREIGGVVVRVSGREIVRWSMAETGIGEDRLEARNRSMWGPLEERGDILVMRGVAIDIEPGVRVRRARFEMPYLLWPRRWG